MIVQLHRLIVYSFNGEHYLEVVLNCTKAQVAADGGTRAAVLVRAAAACSLATRAQARARGAVLVSPLQQDFRWNWELGRSYFTTHLSMFTGLQLN